MKIETAIILCAGYGKRLHPITLEVPKPLIKIKNKSLLLNTIELVANLGIKKIKLNTYYLAEQIEDFVNKLENYGKIEIIKDGDEILDTGGGIKNIMKTSTDENFLVLNPDTILKKNCDFFRPPFPPLNLRFISQKVRKSTASHFSTPKSSIFFAEKL